jgi:transposase
VVAPGSQPRDYNLLFRWFTGLGIDDPVWDVTVFTKNRDRLLSGDIAAKFFQAVLGQPAVKALLSDEHFTVDGTLIGRRSGATSVVAPGSQPTGQHEELQTQGAGG